MKLIVLCLITLMLTGCASTIAHALAKQMHPQEQRQ